MAVSISFQHVTKTFGNTVAVDEVSLNVEPGELFFLLGPSGCGKTTLLRCLAGFYQPDSGRILIDAQDMTGLPPHRRETGMVFQSYALWPHMTVRDNVAFGLQMRKCPGPEIERRVQEVLDLVRVADRAGYKPNQLSGGQQQRVALARALVIHPRCLLLDEPLSNLDAKLRLDMRGEIRRICKQSGITALYVTHDQKEALSLADRLAVMREGRAVQVGTPRQIYRRPADRFVADFIGETNFLDGRLMNATPGAWRVSTALGEMVGTGRLAPGAKNGDAVVVCLRPETIRLDAEASESPNVFGLSLDRTVYLGETAQHAARAFCASPEHAGTSDHAVELKVFELNPRVMAQNTSERIKAWVHPDDVVLLTS